MNVYGVFYSYSDFDDGGHELLKLFQTKEDAEAFVPEATSAIVTNVLLDRAVMEQSIDIPTVHPELDAAIKAHTDHVSKYDFLDSWHGCVDRWKLEVENVKEKVRA